MSIATVWNKHEIIKFKDLQILERFSSSKTGKDLYKIDNEVGVGENNKYSERFNPDDLVYISKKI